MSGTGNEINPPNIVIAARKWGWQSMLLEEE